MINSELHVLYYQITIIDACILLKAVQHLYVIYLLGSF